MVSHTITAMMFILGMLIVVGEGAVVSINVESPHFNGSFCPSNNGITIICAGSGVPVASEWFVNGTRIADDIFRDSQTYPRILNLMSDTSIIINITNAVRESLSLISITSIISGNFTTLSGSTIQWGSDNLRSDPILVEAYAPEDVSIVILPQPSYGVDLRLKSISLSWQLVGLMQCQVMYEYRIVVKDTSSKVITSKNKNCSAAGDQSQCVADIDISGDMVSPQYVVEITQDTFSVNATHIIAGFAGSNSASSSGVRVIASDCLEIVTCVSNIDGTCEVYIGRNRNDSMSRDPITGSTNTSISTSILSLNWRDDVFFVAIFNTTNSFDIVGNFSIEGASKLSGWNTAFIIIGLLLWAASVVLIIMVILTNFNIKRNIPVVIVVFEVILTVIGGILWFVIAVVVGPKEDTCNTRWQSSRDGLIIVSCIVAIVSVVFELSSLVYLGLGNMKKAGRKEHKKVDVLIDTHGIDLENTKIIQQGKTTAEAVVVQGHKAIGETTAEGSNRVKEEVSQAVIVKKREETTTSSNYANLDQIGNKRHIKSDQPRTTAANSNTYSALDRRKTGKNSVAPESGDEYSGLKHITGAQGPPQGGEVPNRNQIPTNREQYGELDISQMDHSPSNPRGRGQGSGPNLKDSNTSPKQKPKPHKKS